MSSVLQEAEVAAVEIVFVPHVVYLVQLLDAIEIEVVDRVAITSGIFVDDGKGRRGDDILYSQLFADSFYKCCFPAPILP